MAIRIRLLSLTGYMLDGARAVGQVFDGLPKENTHRGGSWDGDRVVAAWQDLDKAQEWVAEYSRSAEKYYGSFYLPSTVEDEHKTLADYLPKVRSIEKLGDVIEFTTSETGRLVRCLPSNGRAAVFQAYFGEQGSLREAGRLMAQVGENDKLRVLGLTLTPEEL